MSGAIIFTVPGEPQGKGRARIGKAGKHARMFTPAKTVAYESLIALAAQQAMAGAPLITGPVMLTVQMFHPIRPSWSKKKQADALANIVRPTIKCDADNCMKAVCDALNGVAWKDDVQVVDAMISKRFSETPRVIVSIIPLDAPGI